MDGKVPQRTRRLLLLAVRAALRQRNEQRDATLLSNRDLKVAADPCDQGRVTIVKRKIPQRTRRLHLLAVRPALRQLDKGRDAAGLCDRNLVLDIVRKERQRKRRLDLLAVRPAPRQRHKRRDAAGLCDRDLVPGVER